jgi:hypothetical protein
MFVVGHATCQQIPAQFVIFFSNVAYWWPSDQSSVNVDRPIKICDLPLGQKYPEASITYLFYLLYAPVPVPEAGRKGRLLQYESVPLL